MPTISPAPPSVSTHDKPRLDVEITRIFNESAAETAIPKDMAWAPDSTKVAYIRKTRSRTKEMVPELWIHELVGHRQRPLVANSTMPVDTYDWCGANDLVVVINGDIYWVPLSGEKRQLTQTEAAEKNAKCTKDSTKIAYTREHNLYFLEVATSKELPVSHVGTKNNTFGEVTWVYGEEFNTQNGFGWSPDSRRLWFYHMDLSGVSTRSVMAGSPEWPPISQYYPRPGEQNPVVRIGVADTSGDEVRTTWIGTGDLEDAYLPQVTWHPDSRTLVATRLDRLQTALELLLCTVDTGACQIVLTERDPRWVNLPDPPELIQQGEAFLVLLERDDFSHIYKIDRTGQGIAQLTKGDFVVSSIDAVDEADGTIFFRANKEQTTSWGLFQLSIADGKIDPISDITGTHKALFSPDMAYYVDTHSSLTQPVRVDLYDRRGQFAARVAGPGSTHTYDAAVTNDIIPISAEDGETLNALLTRPTVIDPTRRYPVLIYVYGGPHSQIVRDAFSSKYQPWRNLMASRGVLVFSVDGRGTYGRGHKFETAIHRRLGEIELADQLAGVAYLKTLPFVDPDRIGIFGWSYGGTMVLNAMLRTREVFRAGVSVAPVTDWRYYDTAYTERYMQRPTDNPDGYEATSLLPLADNLDAPLLLIHGLADDNVHFTHTALLVDALIGAGKDFEVLFYPGKDHGIRGSDTRAHLFTRITRFFERHL